MKKTTAYNWRFAKYGGVSQLQLKTGKDLIHLRELDLKLWTALSMPTKGVFFSEETSGFIDTDKDGNIRPEELLSAVDWICTSLKNPDLLFEPCDAIPIDEIKSQELASSARALLSHIDKQTAKSICFEDICTQKRFFKDHVLKSSDTIDNNASDEYKLKIAIEVILASIVCGEKDIATASEKVLNTFYEQTKEFFDWHQKLTSDNVLPLSADKTEKALVALKAIEQKY